MSLEDDLLVRYGIEALIAGRVVSGSRDEPLDHPVLRGEIARAQRIIEGQNDDPFRNQIGMMLTGPGRATIAIYAAALMAPLLLLWGLVDRFLRKRTKRRGDLFRT